MSTEIAYSLDTMPEGTRLEGVTARPSKVAGHLALRVELTDEITLNGTPGLDYIDQPTFVRLPVSLRTGIIEVDILSRLNNKTDFDSQAFAGVAFHIADDSSSFAAVYLRPLNGRRLEPNPPRNTRAVQYFAYPDYPFSLLRERYPDGRYEAGADIAPDEWIRLRVNITDDQIVATVNGDVVLDTSPLAPATVGQIGLFVDIGSEGHFRDLRVTADDHERFSPPPSVQAL